MRFVSGLFVVVIVSLVLTSGCVTDDKNAGDHADSLVRNSMDNLLFVGDDTLKFMPVYDSLICRLEAEQYLERPYTDTGLTGFETERRDSIFIGNYKDYYDKCGCFILDTFPVVNPGRYLKISKFSGKISSDELIIELSKRFEFQSPLAKYTVESLQFSAYCTTGDCQSPWQFQDASAFDADMKNSIRKYFNGDMYLVLYSVVVKDEKGKRLFIHPWLCWQAK